jgi:bifunctional enzyme CysN/CysC/sulfate adenylyltransferase subunit 1
MTAPANVPIVGSEDRELLRFVVVGSVDDGKSTLIGRLLYEANGLCDDHISNVRRATKQVGEEIDFSLFTDGLKAEREQGITIDVAYRSFATPKRRFIVADTPGHVQYTRNMATGASTAEVAIILIDARLGVLPQSRRHAYLASMLGIRHLAVAVNKMDLVGFDAAVFERIRAELGAFLKPLRFEGVHWFPISAKAGDNVVGPSARTPWHSGGSLLDFLNTVPARDERGEGPFRFPVQLVLRPHLQYRGFAGQVASGSVAKGDEVVVLPSGRRTRVAGIDTFEGEIERTFDKASVTLRLADEVDVSRGDVLAHPASAPKVVKTLEANLVWLNERPLDRARQYLVKHSARLVPAKLERVVSKLDLEMLAHESADSLSLNDVGRVRWHCLRPLCVDAYAQVRATGAFIVIDAVTNDTVAAGMIDTLAALDEKSEARSQLTAEQREARLGQEGGVVLAETLQQAYALEAELFAKGFAVTVVDSDARAAAACAEGGLVCICVGDRRVESDLELLGARLIAAEAARAGR